MVLLWKLLFLAAPVTVKAWAGPKQASILPKETTPCTTPLSSRRGFLLTAASLGIATTSSSPANAETEVKPDARVYQPAPHSLDDKVMVITGATTGLGLESSKRLAAAGSTVVMTSRTPEKGQAAVDMVQEYLKEHSLVNDHVYFVTLDLDDLENVKSFPQRLKSTLKSDNIQIDVLMNNAGVMAIPDRQLTKDGYERTFQSNHLGHFALTAKLFPMLSEDARIINVSSEAHQFASKGLELDNLNGERQYGPWSSYGQSKLANILFSEELQRRSEAQNKSSITAVSLHPGAVQTDLSRNMMSPDQYNAMKSDKSWKSQLLSRALSAVGVVGVEEGASTQVWLAAGQGSNVGGKYFVNCKPKSPANAAYDVAKAQQLWTRSEELTGVKFDF